MVYKVTYQTKCKQISNIHLIYHSFYPNVSLRNVHIPIFNTFIDLGLNFYKPFTWNSHIHVRTLALNARFCKLRILFTNNEYSKLKVKVLTYKTAMDVRSPIAVAYIWRNCYCIIVPVKLWKKYNLCRVFVNRLTTLNLPKLRHKNEKRSSFFFLWKFPNKTFESDRQQFFCQSCDNPASINQHGWVFDSNFSFSAIQMTSISSKTWVIGQAFIDFQVKY